VSSRAIPVSFAINKASASHALARIRNVDTTSVTIRVAHVHMGLHAGLKTTNVSCHHLNAFQRILQGAKVAVAKNACAKNNLCAVAIHGTSFAPIHVESCAVVQTAGNTAFPTVKARFAEMMGVGGNAVIANKVSSVIGDWLVYPAHAKVKSVGTTDVATFVEHANKGSIASMVDVCLLGVHQE